MSHQALQFISMQSKNSDEFFAASPSGEPMVPGENQRLEKNGTFFAMREGSPPYKFSVRLPFLT